MGCCRQVIYICILDNCSSVVNAVLAITAEITELQFGAAMNPQRIQKALLNVGQSKRRNPEQRAKLLSFTRRWGGAICNMCWGWARGEPNPHGQQLHVAQGMI